MDFFGTQDAAQVRSRAFFIAFGLAVAGAVAVLYFVITGCFLVAGSFSPFKGYYPGNWWAGLVHYSLPAFIYGPAKKILALRPMLILLPLITASILLLSYYKTSLIKKGGGAYVAEAMGGVLIRKAQNDDEKRLVNVVEEMSLAAGLPKPRIYLMPKEWSINAVTAGLDYEDAIIAVTAGSLKHLDRDELQGVVAHEYAHILNGDYALNLTMAGWLYGLLFFSVQGRDMMDVARTLTDANSGGENGTVAALLALPMFFMGLIIWVGGWVGKLAAELTQAAMSRQREQMADAFAVQFTRNPRGLAGALKKIAAFPQHGVMRSGQAMMMKSFFIVSPGRLRGLMRSHPPLEDRIFSLDPGWDGTIPELVTDGGLWPLVNARSSKLKISSEGVKASVKSPKQLLEAAGRLEGNWVGTLVLGMLAGHVGLFDQADQAVNRSLELSRRMYERMPQELRQAVNDAGLVSSLISAVFLSDSPEPRERQAQIIAEALGPENAERAAQFKPLLENELRLPLLSLSSPTLNALSEDARSRLSQAVTALAAADGRLDLFEIAALQILKKRLNIRFGYNAEENANGSNAADYIESVQTSVVTVLSALARLSERRNREDQVKEAFAAGMAHFNQWPTFEVLPKEECTSKKLILALENLGKAPDKVRNTMILATVSAALQDNYISPEEYELLRALAAAIDIPLPYFVV